MAQKVQVLLVDDLSGGEADETVSFALDGTSYEIDLTAKHAAELRDAFARYVGAARKAGSARSASSAAAARRPRARSRDSRSADIREWARQKGHKVSDRGRIPARVVADYDKAHA